MIPMLSQSESLLLHTEFATITPSATVPLFTVFAEDTSTLRSVRVWTPIWTLNFMARVLRERDMADFTLFAHTCAKQRQKNVRV